MNISCLSRKIPGFISNWFVLFQLIWDEVGESDDDRDKMLLQLEQECLDVYRRKVDQASSSRARLLQQLANSKSELNRLLSSLGELSISGGIVVSIWE